MAGRVAVDARRNDVRREDSFLAVTLAYSFFMLGIGVVELDLRLTAEDRVDLKPRSKLVQYYIAFFRVRDLQS